MSRQEEQSIVKSKPVTIYHNGSPVSSDNPLPTSGGSGSGGGISASTILGGQFNDDIATTDTVLGAEFDDPIPPGEYLMLCILTMSGTNLTIADGTLSIDLLTSEDSAISGGGFTSFIPAQTAKTGIIGQYTLGLGYRVTGNTGVKYGVHSSVAPSVGTIGVLVTCTMIPLTA